MKAFFRKQGVLLVLVAALCSGGPVYAQKVLQDFKKSLPKVTLLAPEEFEKITTLHYEVPFGDSNFSYEVRIPSAWSVVDDVGMGGTSLNSKILGDIARFYSPSHLGGERSRFTIQALTLDYQLTAEQWLLQHMLSRGYNIQGLTSDNERSGQSFFVAIESDTSYAVRASAWISGKNIILAQYYLPMDFWEEEKTMQAQVIDSFRLTAPSDEYVENMVPYYFLDVAGLRYPESWKLRAMPLRSIDFMNIELLNVAGTGGGKVMLDGKIEVRLASSYSSESPEYEIENIVSALESAQMMVGDVIEKGPELKVDASMSNPALKIYKASNPQEGLVDYEFWIASMEAGDYYYFVTLLTLARDQDYFIWSRNTQTFLLVTSLLSAQADSMVER